MLAANQQLLLMQQQQLPPLSTQQHHTHHLHHHLNNSNNNNNNNSGNNSSNNNHSGSSNTHTTYNSSRNKQHQTTTNSQLLVSPSSSSSAATTNSNNNHHNNTSNNHNSRESTGNMDGYHQAESPASIAASHQASSNQLATFITTIVSLSPQELSCLCADNLFIDTLREANDVITSKINKIRLLTQQQNHLLLQMHHHQQQQQHHHHHHHHHHQQQPSQSAQGAQPTTTISATTNATSMSALDLRSFTGSLGQGYSGGASGKSGYDKIDYLAAVALATAANQQHSAAAAVAAAAAAAASYLSNNSPTSASNNHHRNTSSSSSSSNTNNTSAASSTNNTSSNTANNASTASQHIQSAATQYYYDALYANAAAAGQLSPGQTHPNQSSTGTTNNDSHHHHKGAGNHFDQSYYIQRQIDYLNEQSTSVSKQAEHQRLSSSGNNNNSNNSNNNNNNINNNKNNNYSPSSDRSSASSYPSPPNRSGSPGSRQGADQAGAKKRKYNQQSDNSLASPNHYSNATNGSSSNLDDGYSNGDGPIKKKRITKPRIKKPLIETNQVYHNSDDPVSHHHQQQQQQQHNIDGAMSSLSGSHHHHNGTSGGSSGGLLMPNYHHHHRLAAMDHHLLESKPGIGPIKKHKGEFDEPTFAEVEQRQRILERVGNYHTHSVKTGECACVLGSQFPTRSARDVLAMVQEWHKMDVERRVLQKWDAADLPKDIPLSEISKYELLRKEASGGQANFGGTSKRKPLGIRGTRQFLLILYCLWGHPGSQDEMQREGYCPHCFAKIRKANDQSTLVRVVNHFNMKHRQGHNPRLSPSRDIDIELKSNDSPPAPDNHTMDEGPSQEDGGFEMGAKLKEEPVEDDQHTEDTRDNEANSSAGNLDILNRALTVTECTKDERKCQDDSEVKSEQED